MFTASLYIEQNAKLINARNVLTVIKKKFKMKQENTGGPLIFHICELRGRWKLEALFIYIAKHWVGNIWLVP